MGCALHNPIDGGRVNLLCIKPGRLPWERALPNYCSPPVSGQANLIVTQDPSAGVRSGKIHN